MSPFLPAALGVALAAAVPTQSFVAFESGPVAPLRLAPDASRLFVADTLGGRLCVFDLRDAAAPFLLAEILVGLEPVAVQARTRDEVWVVDQLSDSVSIVDVAALRVIDTLRVVDEPSDVVFAGGRAFVTAATTDAVHVFDALTRAPLGTIPIFGKDPRALAVSPDGARVYALVQRSGNGTTILPEGVQAPPPAGPGLPPAPPQGIVVRADDPAWGAQIPFSLPDHDVAQIDVATLQVTRYFDAVGTTNTGLAVHPGTGDLWVANTHARNLVRFEPALRGHAIDSRLTRITTGAAPVVTTFDLNAGLDYTQLPNPAALATALAEPFGVAIDAATGLVWVAAHGTDRIGVVAANGSVQARIELGNAPGAAVATRQKRGPRALALHPTQPRLYVLNRLSDTLVVIDTATRTVLGEQPIATSHPASPAWREGRNFLYDAKLSGNGTMSCAACHVDADLDGLAWDLGDPNGALQPAPPQPFPFGFGLAPFHPMKGPTTTQTLRGLQGTGVLHWRGDRADFQAFNGAFATLLGGALLPAQDMNDFAAFAASLVHPPNPVQQLDRSWRTTPAANNEAAGLAAFQQNVAGSILPTGTSCATCHTLPRGTNGMVITASVLDAPQQMKVPQLRNLYRKVGFARTPGPKKIGFGFTHDGAVDTLPTFLGLSVFNPWPAATKDDVVTFLGSFDTGTAPAVGYRFVLNAANATSAPTTAALALATARAAAGDVDLTAHGLLDGRLAGLLYEPAGLPGGPGFVGDRAADAPLTLAQLVAKAQAGHAALAFTAVPPGSGVRIALDRDLDGARNGDEDATAYGTASPGCAGAPALAANSEPRVANAQFGFVLRGAAPGMPGILALALGGAVVPVLGITVLVDPASAVPIGLAADALGEAVHRLPIPAAPALAGFTIHAQALWLDACGPEWWAATRGLQLTVRT